MTRVLPLWRGSSRFSPPCGGGRAEAHPSEGSPGLEGPMERGRAGSPARLRREKDWDPDGRETLDTCRAARRLS